MISVIIPAYNEERFIATCLDSLLQQTYSDWEAVIVNDGSTDSTAEIVEGYAARDSRFRLISIPNSGQSTARNAAFEHVSGEWIAFLDADDAFTPGALEGLLRAVENSGAPVAYGNFSYVDDINLHTLGRNKIEGTTRVVDAIDVAEQILYQTSGGAIATVCDKLWNRNAIGETRFSDGIWFEDLDFNLKVIPRLDKVAVTDCPVYLYRNNPASFLHRFNEGRFDSIRVTGEMEQRFAENPRLLAAARERRMSAAFNILWLLTINPERRQQYDETARECWKLVKERRYDSLLNPAVRPKNRAAALISYLGRPFTESILRFGNRFKLFQPPQAD